MSYSGLWLLLNPDSKVHGANMGPFGSCRPQMGHVQSNITFPLLIPGGSWVSDGILQGIACEMSVWKRKMLISCPCILIIVMILMLLSCEVLGYFIMKTASDEKVGMTICRCLKSIKISISLWSIWSCCFCCIFGSPISHLIKNKSMTDLLSEPRLSRWYQHVRNYLQENKSGDKPVIW